jgi:HEAT repeat protein
MDHIKSTWTTALIVVSLVTSGLRLAAQAPPTIEQALQAKGVQTSIVSLRNALKDQRPEVRGLAAAMLAENKDRESIPAINQALMKASSTQERESLAQALLIFGDPAGMVEMQKICQDSEALEDLRLIVANQLADVGSNACIGSVIEILSSTNDHAVRQNAMQFLKRGGVVPPAARVNDLQSGLEKALQDEIPSNRQTASECILLFHLSSAGDSLRRAVNVEKDPATRIRMQSDLSKLENTNIPKMGIPQK